MNKLSIKLPGFQKIIGHNIAELISKKNGKTHSTKVNMSALSL